MLYAVSGHTKILHMPDTVHEAVPRCAIHFELLGI